MGIKDLLIKITVMPVVLQEDNTTGCFYVVYSMCLA